MLTQYMIHNLRTPLASIAGFSDLLCEEGIGLLNPRQKDYIFRIRKNVDLLQEQINSLGFSDPTNKKQSDQAKALHGFSPSKNILIVDDNEASRVIHRDTLELSGYTVLEMARGSGVVQCAIKQCPDLILLDLNLPDFSGFEVNRQLKNSRKTKNIPVVFISAMPNIAEKQDYLKSGCVGFLEKPFSLSFFLEQVNSFIRCSKNYKKKALESPSSF